MSKSTSAVLRGQRLIKELLTDSASFEREGKSYNLLQEYFHGLPVESLRTLLSHDDPIVRRAGIWITSELGGSACSLIDQVIPLLDADRYMRYHALEIVMLCSIGQNVAQIIHVLTALEDSDQVIRVLVMFLLKNASVVQLDAAYECCLSLGSSAERHRIGIQVLLRRQSVEPLQIASMIDDSDALIRRYGAIAAERVWDTQPDLIYYASASSDEDIRRFAEKMLKLHKIAAKT